MAVTSVAVVLCGALLAACGASDDKSSDNGDLVIGIAEEPDNLNPIFGDIYGSVYGDHWPVFSSLLSYDKNLELQPDLAEEKPDVSDDGRTVTVKVRDDATWHDGEHVTAKDVEFTYESILDPDVATALRGLWFDSLDSVDAVDDHTVEFHLKRVDPAFPAKLTTGVIPEHLLAGEDLNKAEFNKDPVGSGPFKFDDIRSGERMTLSANKDYYGDDVDLDKVVFRFIEDDDSRARQVKNGDVDVDAQGLNARAAKQFEGADNFDVESIPGALLTLTMPTTNDLLDSAEVRRAIGMAIDRDELIEGLEDGTGRTINGPFFPGNWANSDKAATTYDPGKAQKALEDAGWKKDDGALSKDGQELSFDLVYGHGGTEDAAALAIRDQLAKVGIKAKPKKLEYEQLQEAIGKGSVSLQDLGNAYDPALDVYNTFHSDLADGDDEDESNIANIKDKAIDKAIEKGQSTTDKKARKKAYDELQSELKKQGSWQYLLQRDDFYVINSDIEGVDPQIREGHVHGFSRGLLWNLQDWSIAAE